MICALLRAHAIACADRATNLSAERGAGFGGWTEVVVREDDLEAARELLASRPAG